jgi:hypothetical protein
MFANDMPIFFGAITFRQTFESRSKLINGVIADRHDFS